MARKKQEIHGQVVGVYELAGMKTSSYSHKTKEEYESWLKQLPLTDIQNHAIEVGLVPVDNREMLTERLIREYCKVFGAVLMGAGQSGPPLSKKSEKLLKDLLKNGR